MGGTLTEQRRVKEEGIRSVNFCYKGRTADIGNDIRVTVLYEKATANYVPAAAVIRLSLIHISEPTRLLSISYAVFGKFY